MQQRVFTFGGFATNELADIQYEWICRELFRMFNTTVA